MSRLRVLGASVRTAWSWGLGAWNLGPATMLPIQGTGIQRMPLALQVHDAQRHSVGVWLLYTINMIRNPKDSIVRLLY